VTTTQLAAATTTSRTTRTSPAGRFRGQRFGTVRTMLPFVRGCVDIYSTLWPGPFVEMLDRNSHSGICGYSFGSNIPFQILRRNKHWARNRCRGMPSISTWLYCGSTVSSSSNNSKSRHRMLSQLLVLPRTNGDCCCDAFWPCPRRISTHISSVAQKSQTPTVLIMLLLQLLLRN
jgi:hypothetical protein